MNNMLMLGLDLMSGVIAQEEPRQTGPDFGKASPIGFIIVVFLLIGVFVLVWSMNRHLRRLPESFDEADSADEAGGNRVGGTVVIDTDRGTENPADGTKREPG